MTGRWGKKWLDREISRRSFLKAAGAAAVIAASGAALGCVSSQSTTTPGNTPTPAPARAPAAHSGKLAVASDPDPAKAVDKALDAFGGLADIVKSGDKVLVKANFSWVSSAAEGACNHPDVLARILQRLKDAGAAEVIAVDNTIDFGPLCLDTSGIRAAVEKAGFSAVNVSNAGDFVDQTFKCGDLGSVKVMKRLYDADVFVDVPVIKSHSNTKMTASLKNLMGMIYDRQAFHSSASLDQCIADLGKALHPDLVIADGYRVMMTGGPGGGRNSSLSTPHEVAVGDDMVAVDAYAATLLGLDPLTVEHVKAAYDAGLGEIDTGRLNFIRA